MTDADRKLARDYFPAFRDRDEAWWERFIAPEFVRHDPGLPFEVRGPAGVRKLGEMMHGGLSEVGFDIGDVVGDGDKVLVRLKMRGRHTGEFMGVKPTKCWVNIDVMDFFRVGDGRLVEHWALMDNLSLLQQIGAVPRQS